MFPFSFLWTVSIFFWYYKHLFVHLKIFFQDKYWGVESFGKTVEMFNDLETQNQIDLQETLCYFILLIEAFEKACLTAPSPTLKQFDSK